MKTHRPEVLTDEQFAELERLTVRVLQFGNLVLESSLLRIADENGGSLALWATAELDRRAAVKRFEIGMNSPDAMLGHEPRPFRLGDLIGGATMGSKRS
jgi:hypothetical protein